MAVPTNKAELLAAIELSYQKLAKDFSQLPAELAELKTMPGHAKDTVMSPKDLASYLLGWAELVLKWDRQLTAGVATEFPENGFKWNELGRLAGKFYTDYQGLKFHEVLDRLDKAVSQILELVESKSNEQLYGTSWYEKWTQGRMIQFNTSSPYANARGRLRKWLKDNQPG